MSRLAHARLTAIVRGAGAVSTLALVGFWTAYCLTYEPAPSVKVRWPDGLSVERRTDLEDKYLLVNAEGDPPAAITYDLLDTSRENIVALVNDPNGADTTGIDRTAMEIPFDVGYGDSWMWVAHRTPGLRRPDERGAVIGTLVLVALLAGLLEMRR